ncbi:MAG: 5-formyltetrahydrofolate cyclo-ligase [Verrucomicrobiota bacterium]|jgi:5-formyltetrahydrofolate cyclo-ligase
MTADLNFQKAVLRKQMRGILQKISPAAREAASAQVRALLKEQSIWKNAASVLFFAPMSNEVDVWPLLEEALNTGKTAALPRFDSADQSYVACRVQNLRSEIVTGEFGIREPAAKCAEIPLSKFDLVLVPGVAFDLRGYRLGRGRGFYDRLLAEVRGAKCGVAFDKQIASDVPAGMLDVQVNFILTATRCVKVEE